MKRDIRKLNRVRRLVALIDEAHRAGWSRSIDAWRNPKHPAGHPEAVSVVVVHLTLPETDVYSAAWVTFYFWRHWSRDGWTTSVRSCYGKRRKRNGAPLAARLIRNLNEWQGNAAHWDANKRGAA